MTRQELKDETQSLINKVDTALVVAEIGEGVQIAAKGSTGDIAALICVALDDIKKNTKEPDWLAIKLSIMGHLTDSFDKILERLEASAGEVIYEAEEE